MRGSQQGGRFTPDYESNSVATGINEDLQRFSGTYAEWWVFNPENTTVDDLYDVGALDGVGRQWDGPFPIPVIRALITQGQVPLSERGFYNADILHLTLNASDLDNIHPGVVGNPDLQNRGRIVWLGEVFRPIHVQQSGIVSNRFHLVVADCIQVTSEELINDPQFQDYV
jgi:hypothetical protein